MTVVSLIKAFEYKAKADQEIITFGKSQLAKLPHDDATFFIRILNHITVIDAIFLARLTGKSIPHQADNTPETPSIDELQATMFANDYELVKLVSGYSAEDLKQVNQFTFLDGQIGTLITEEILLHLLTHGSNHRGMASRTLMGNGLDRPKDTFTRFLHETEPTRRTGRI